MVFTIHALSGSRIDMVGGRVGHLFIVEASLIPDHIRNAAELRLRSEVLLLICYDTVSARHSCFVPNHQDIANYAFA